MPQTGGPQTFAGKQAVRDKGSIKTVLCFKQQARLFEGAFFTGGVNTDKHLCRGQYG
jgi:hypothetical protein